MNTGPTKPDFAVANEIARQIGHRAFVMLGTRHKLGGQNFLSFDIHGCPKFSKVQVTLAPDDTYKVEFFKFRKWEMVRREVVERVYADNLRHVIESKTGLYLNI